MKHFLFLFAFLLSTGSFAQSVKYITPDGAGSKSGVDWANAGDSSMVQAFINGSAANDAIWIAAGTYKPTAYPPNCTDCSSNRDYTFYLKSGVKIYGGFDGTEVTLADRTTILPTTFSGSINSNSNSDNVYHVVTAINLNSGTMLNGIEITGGYANGTTYITLQGVGTGIWQSSGGGIFSYNSNAVIRHCNIRVNYAYEGGGMYYTDCAQQIDSTFITNNTAMYHATSSGGGGIYAASSNDVIDHCVFKSNVVTNFGGGAIRFVGNTSGTIKNSIFEGNRATQSNGGAIVVYTGNTTNIYNCVFRLNSTSANGADLVIGTAPNTTVNVTGCTMWGSTADDGYGDIRIAASCTLYIQNTVMWKFTPTFQPGGTKIFSYTPGNGTHVDANENYTVENNTLSPGFKDSSSIAGPDGKYFTMDDGFNLTCNSPLREGGLYPGGLNTDILGRARLNNADIGAYEETPLGNYPNIDSLIQVVTPACVGDSALFRVVLSAPLGNFNYVWYVNNTAVQGDSLFIKTLLISGVNTIRYRLTSPTYCGGVNNITRTLNVNPSSIGTPAITIASATGAKVCSIASSVAFTATPTYAGTAPVYQWYRNSQPVGTNSTSYVATGYQLGDTIYCVLTSNYPCATTTSAASNKIIIQSIPDPTFTSISSNPTIFSGSNTSFTTAIANTGIFTYQWQVDAGAGFNNIPVGTPYAVSSSNLASTLNIAPAVISMNNYQYRCIATDTCGRKDTSSIGILNVLPIQNLITTQPVSATICYEGSINVVASATCPNKQYQWQSKQTGGAFVNVPGATSASLSITCGKQYRCIVSCGTGNRDTSSIAVMTCNVPVNITQQPVSLEVCEGGTATLSITAVGYNLSYEWFRVPGSTIVNGTDAYGQVVTGATSATLKIQNAYSSNNQPTISSIRCRVTDGCNHTDLSSIKTMLTNPVADASLTVPFSSMCVNDSYFMLTGGNPAGGVYSGSGVTNGLFDPGMANLGPNTITYTYTDPTCPGSGPSTATQTVTVSVCTGINESEDAAGIAVYPNPSSGELFISIQSGNIANQVAIYNTNGELVLQSNAVDGLTVNRLDVSQLAPGVYIAAIKTADSIVQKRWIKM